MTHHPSFISGLELSRLFYLEAVKPILIESFPDLRFTAALIGSGSEVLGFDTELSSDHHWGPRVMFFLREEDYVSYRHALEEKLRQSLPPRFCGYSTNFTLPDPDDNNTQRLQEVDSPPINHRVEMFTMRGFFLHYLDFDIEQTIQPADWLTFPEQKLRSITAGAVYHDGIDLESVRQQFKYYPHDVWLYLLACGWTRIGQEEHLMGRAGSVGDEIGAAIIGSRLVRDLMRLCFLMEKQFAPYPKWFGHAFSRLECAAELSPLLQQVRLSEKWVERQQHLAMAYEYVAEMHNRLNMTERLPAQANKFFGRPFLVIHLSGGFAGAISACIKDPEVKEIAAKGLIGSIDQISDNTDVLSDSRWRKILRVLYE